MNSPLLLDQAVAPHQEQRTRLAAHLEYALASKAVPVETFNGGARAAIRESVTSALLSLFDRGTAIHTACAGKDF